MVRKIFDRMKRGLDAAFSPATNEIRSSETGIVDSMFGGSGSDIITEDDAMQIPAVASAIDIISSTVV